MPYPSGGLGGPDPLVRTDSVSGEASVDIQDSASDERGLVRRDEHDRLGKLLREAEATHRNIRYQRRLVLRRRRKTGQHASVRRARRHSVHTDSRVGELERDRLRYSFDRVLASDVDGGLGRPLVPVGRGDVDNASAALSLHDTRLVLHAEEHAEDICVERLGIGGGTLVLQGTDLTFGSRIVYRDVETAEPFDGLVDQSADIILHADVGMDEL